MDLSPMNYCYRGLEYAHEHEANEVGRS